MPPKLREWVYLPRHADLARLFEAIRVRDCLSVVGVSNLGKSATLRALADPAVQAQYLGATHGGATHGDADGYLFVYIDFNQMLEMSDQAFYELVLRCSIDALREQDSNAEILRQVERAYTSLVAPASAFEIPLRFAQAMAALRRPTATVRDLSLRRGGWPGQPASMAVSFLTCAPSKTATPAA